MEFETDKGVAFYDAVKLCKEEIKKTGRMYMMMSFNGLNVTVSFDSNPDDIATIYDLKHKIRFMETKKCPQ